MSQFPSPPPLDAETSPLHPNTQQRVRAAKLGFSLDWWSVIIAIALALLVWILVRPGWLPAIPW